MNALTTLADRVASLVPGIVPAGSASAVVCTYECRPNVCNEGDFFISGEYRVCSDGEGGAWYYIGCC
jgi:hypothetical protein